MTIGISIIIFLIAFISAVIAAQKEFLPPEEVKKIKIRKKKSISGVILFLKKKIIHYSSNSS